jgi:hypothetical protein
LLKLAPLPFDCVRRLDDVLLVVIVVSERFGTVSGWAFKSASTSSD